MKASFLDPKALLDLPSFLLAKLPALVDENPLADGPLMMLRSVICVLELPLVVVLLFPDDELVEFVLVVKVRLSIDRPTSYADFRWRSLGSDCETSAIDKERS